MKYIVYVHVCVLSMNTRNEVTWNWGAVTIQCLQLPPAPPIFKLIMHSFSLFINSDELAQLRMYFTSNTHTMNDIRNTLRENAEQLVILGKHSKNYAPSCLNISFWTSCIFKATLQQWHSTLHQSTLNVMSEHSWN